MLREDVENFNKYSLSIVFAQVAPLVSSSQKTPTKRDPHGMIDTYGGYLKTIVTKSGRQGMAFKGHFCGLHGYSEA